MGTHTAGIDWTHRFSRTAVRTKTPEISWLMAQALEVPGLISLAAGFVDQETLPHETVREALGTLLDAADEVQSPLQYGTTYGDLALRQELLTRLEAEGVLPPGLPLDEETLFLGSGSQQILYLVCETLLDENDIVLLEAPTYFVVLGAMLSRGAQTVGVVTDEYGMNPDALAGALDQLEQRGELHRVKLLYLMSYSTNPQGVTLTLERRKRILEILSNCREKGYPILLLEDAAYRRLCFEEPPPPLFRLADDPDSVLYTESFSKSLSPGLRLGFGVGPKPLIQKMADLKGNHDFGSANLSQQIVKALLRSGGFDHHIALLRERYGGKARLVMELLEELFPPGVSWIEPSGGFYTWVTLPGGEDTGPNGRMFRAALDEKVLYVPGCLCYSEDRPESRHSSSIRLSFGMIGRDRLREGCRRLAEAARKMAPAAGAER